ncbi:hypothetical protein BJX63DRAFT_433545 [Aspergillus granulosus]|uniref:Major facilitator superfamily (MFS) profile domain-containing protein n=1 Tax=Aspergillus granulosus TaxID=176169 RepID=A0ABR4H710_9EURO
METVKDCSDEDTTQEQILALGQIARRHLQILEWSLFWCMCALGWGFDTQVNGAITSVPAFRAYYGYDYKGSPTIPAH